MAETIPDHKVRKAELNKVSLRSLGKVASV
jgi:hypothetical protein